MTRLILPTLLAAALAAGCTTGRVASEGSAAVAPSLSVERFLQAANDRDLESMARLFGTVEGPIADTGGPLGCAFRKLGSWFGMSHRCVTKPEVELRMDAIAGILRHQDYQIVSQADVPGRLEPTVRIGVDLTIRGEIVRDVPFVLVRTREGRWLVQEIGLTKITGG